MSLKKKKRITHKTHKLLDSLSPTDCYYLYQSLSYRSSPNWWKKEYVKLTCNIVPQMVHYNTAGDL